MLGVPGGQMFIDGASQHLAGSMAEAFDGCEVGIPARSIWSEFGFSQQGHQLLKLLLRQLPS